GTSIAPDMRILKTYHNNILRLVTADIAHKRPVGTVVIVTAGRVRHLRRASFAAKAVLVVPNAGLAVDAVVFTDRISHKVADVSADFRLDHVFFDHFWRHVINTAIAVNVAVHQVRLIVRTAIDHGVQGTSHLQQGFSLALPKGGVGILDVQTKP